MCSFVRSFVRSFDDRKLKVTRLIDSTLTLTSSSSRSILRLPSECLVAGGRVVEVELARAEGFHDGIEDTELTGGQGTDHDATRG